MEVRMGSPYNAGSLNIEGEFIPDMENYSFQDISLVSESGFECYIVQWETRGNIPGFVVWKLDGRNKKLEKSAYFSGFCSSLYEKEESVIVEYIDLETKEIRHTNL